MNEKDAIKDLFSNAFEQHSASVRPEVWQGLQAKMAAAGVAGASATAVKGISALTKWIIGGAAVVGTATVATVLLFNEGPKDSPENKIVVAGKTPTENTVGPDQQKAERAVITAPSVHPSETLSETALPAAQSQPARETVLIQNSGATETNPSVAGPVKKADPNPDPVQTNPKQPEAEKQLKNPVNPVPNETGNGSGTSGGAVIQPVAKITRIPNVLTPNHDGDNDEFFIESENITDFSVVFLNSAGQLVYKSADPEFRWDGTDLSGEPVPNGQYRCLIVASGADKKPIKRLEMVVVAR